MGTTRDFRSEGLPVLEPAAIVGVDLGMDFTAEELDADSRAGCARCPT
jgi:hypothetical protein